MQLNQQQQNISDWVPNGTGSAIIVARAGCGKTFSLIRGVVRQIVEHDLGELALMAYNKSAGDEFKVRIEELAEETGDERFKNWKKVQAGTVHSFGFGAVRRWSRDVKVDEHKVRNICRRLADADEERPSVYFREETPIKVLVSLAKQTGFGALISLQDRRAWYDLAEHHAVNDMSDNGNMDEIVEASIVVLKRSIATDREVVDFDDMILAPLTHNIRMWQKDWVLIDEAQDTNATRRALALKMLKPQTGRLVAVGDDRQAIYGFCHPPGTPVMTNNGYKNIENFEVGDSIIVSGLCGEIEGWNGGKKVLEVHQYQHTGMLITITVGDKNVTVTPHHKIPVRVSPNAEYYTYMMRRCGVYRVGHCQAYTTGQFMLQLRRKTEKADSVWILNAHNTKEDAINTENMLLQRIKGTTFHKFTDKEVMNLPSEKIEALKILSEHGRMVDFPLLTNNGRYDVRISRKGAFITEACNVLDGMLSAFYDENQNDTRKRGRGRQKFNWTPIQISSRHYSGPVHGITVDPVNVYKHGDDYVRKSIPLYFAGDNILVHNTGADSDALDLIEKSLGHVEKFPLTITYRCPKAVVKEANQLVPDLTAHESAPEGSVRSIQIVNKESIQDALVHETPWYQNTELFPTDAILCRNTKPLIETAYGLLAAGVGCRVEGREIGAGLVMLATRWKRIKTLPALDDKLGEYKDREVQKWLAKDREDRAQAAEDKVESIRSIIRVLRQGGKTEVEDLVDWIKSMFGDTRPGEKPNVVTLSTVHKSKGREWDRVFILYRDTLMPSPYARKPWQLLQEDNLKYVAITRAKEELVFVD